MERIAIIGGGRIGEALLSGLLSSGWSDIVVTSRRMERVAELHERHTVEATTSNPDAVKGAAIVVVAVKPQDIDALLEEIGPLLSTEQTVLSVAAAVPTKRIDARIDDGLAVRAPRRSRPHASKRGSQTACRSGARCRTLRPWGTRGWPAPPPVRMRTTRIL